MDNKKIEKRSDIRFDGSTAIYTTSYQSLNSGTLIGEFHFRCIILPDIKLAIGREKRYLLGELEHMATEEEKFLAYSLSELKYKVIKAPSFWQKDGPGTPITAEENLIYQVLEASVDAATIYKQQKEEERAILLKSALKSAEAELEKQEKEQSEDEELEDESST